MKTNLAIGTKFKRLRTNLGLVYKSLKIIVTTKNKNLLYNHLCDFDRILHFTGLLNNKTREVLKAEITKNYHRVEKGLSLREPRVGFGRWSIDKLISDVAYYMETYAPDETTGIAINTLIEYIDFNRQHDNVDSQLENIINDLKTQQQLAGSVHDNGGTKKITSDEIYKACKIDLSHFFQNRYSIRNFSDESVDLYLIEKAIKMAQKTPCVCNRQSCRVYVFTEKEDKLKVLAHQNGNRGFTEQIDKVLVVTSQLSCFLTVGERNQCWIDGGMFAMSLVYALHSLGLGTCCLNWSVERDKDLVMKETTGIPDSDSIIMLIAVGHLPKVLKVAQSPRKDLSEVMIVKKL